MFIGIVREEDNIQGLSFDIHEALLKTWFEKWHHKAKDLGVVLKMAHSLGDVLIGQSSFLCVLMGKNRKNALELYEYTKILLKILSITPLFGNTI